MEVQQPDSELWWLRCPVGQALLYLFARRHRAGADALHSKRGGAIGETRRLDEIPALIQTHQERRRKDIAGARGVDLHHIVGGNALRTPRMKLSIAYPVMVSGGYIIILAVSWFLCRERLGVMQYAGVGLILGGIWMVVR
jgi:hypothetical protein